MARRPRKPAAKQPEPTSEPIVEEEEEVVEKAAPKPAPKTHFTAMLKDAISYQYEGMMFRGGIPQTVPIKYLKKFQSNGRFTVTV